MFRGKIARFRVSAVGLVFPSKIGGCHVSAVAKVIARVSSRNLTDTVCRLKFKGWLVRWAKLAIAVRRL